MFLCERFQELLSSLREKFIYPGVLHAIISVRKMLVIDKKNYKNLIPSENVNVGVGATNALKKTTTV